MKLTKAFFEEIRDLIHSARATVARGVDLVQVYTNFEIGRRIVEQELRGRNRADYGQEVMKELAFRLTIEFGNGYSKSNLEYMRRFFLQYEERRQIAQSMTGQLVRGKITQSVTGQLPEENPTIGIVLCRQKNKAFVEITLPKGTNIHAKEYQLYLPAKEELQRKLIEWGNEAGGEK